MSEKLSLLNDSSDSEVELTINKSYANSYNQWRNKEELQKYKDLKKDEEDSESSSESEEEIPEFDEEFFRAFSLLKGKDPRIYDKNFELFKKKEVIKKPKPEKKKPLYMKDYERNLVLEKGGKFSDEEDGGNIPDRVPTTYDEEQMEIKKSFNEAVESHNLDDDADDLFNVRTKTKKEEEDEEADYVKWLKGEEKEISEDVKKDMTYLRNYWNDPSLDEGEKFLRDYILNKKYLEKDDSDIPTYEELTSGMLSDDEKILNEQETFEHKYNFRFEEPDEEFIKRYPRTIGDSLRRTDNRRKQKREEKAERKKKEKEQRREELKRLKALKRKEIEEKFMKLKEISGQDEINLNESDIESDFDPDKHDQKMREMFNDDYYQVAEDQKPEFPYDEELDSENWNAWAGEKIIDDDDDANTKEKKEESNQEKSDFRENFANEIITSSRPKKKVKKKSLFAKIISQPKPVYDPDGKSFEEYLDEYYKLDYEDIVGDMPVRYKYRKVIPNDFGLTVDEILAADDKELNRWCSVKKTCQYRKDEEELYDVQAFHKKAQVPTIKKKCFPSIYAPKEVDDVVTHSCSSNSENTIEKTVKGGAQFNENDNKQQEMKQDSDFQLHHKKKSKKNKNKRDQDTSINSEEPNSVNDIEMETRQDCLVMENEYVYSDATNTANVITENSSSILENSSDHKLSKRKKRHCKEDSFHESESGNNVNKLVKRQKVDYTEDSLGDLELGDNANKDVSENLNSNHEKTFEGPTKKKKKKNKKYNKHRENGVTSSGAPVTDSSKSKTHHNNFKNRCKQHAAEDKRLGLSDERLAAYGINPKKFKNRIIYSKH